MTIGDWSPLQVFYLFAITIPFRDGTNSIKKRLVLGGFCYITASLSRLLIIHRRQIASFPIHTVTRRSIIFHLKNLYVLPSCRCSTKERRSHAVQDGARVSDIPLSGIYSFTF